MVTVLSEEGWMTHVKARQYERAFKVAALERMAAGENVSALSRELGIRRKLDTSIYRISGEVEVAGAARGRGEAVGCGWFR